jgi:hypothetical protein
MSQSSHQPSRAEQWAGYAILLCLAGVAAGVWLKQASFNPAVLVATAATQAPAGSLPSPAAGEAAPTLPPELTALSAAEAFGPDDVYKKIDGKADLYLTAGFVSMRCQRLALKANADQWLEYFVYDMGKMSQAFAVYSVQRRPEAQPLDLTPFAYQTPNALYLVSGHYYLEVVTAMPGPPMMSAMLALARQLVAQHPPGAERIPELDLFPPEDLAAGEQSLQAADAFGFDQFTNVFTASYHAGKGEALAFFTELKTPAAAAALRDAYRAFLLANDGKELPADGTNTLGRPINFMDAVEVVFAKGNRVAGVHAAPDAATAAKIAQRLADRLPKEQHE